MAKTIAKKEPEGTWLEAIQAEVVGDNTPIDVLISDRHGKPYSDGEGGQAVIQVLGVYSDAVRAFDHSSRGAGLDPEERHSQRLAAATAGWKLVVGGVPAPFSKESAALLFKAAPWIADKVWLAMSARADFSGGKSAA